MKCDFCSAPATHRIPCRTFRFMNTESTGDFAACDLCKDRVDTGDPVGLMKRSRDNFRRRHGFWNEDAESFLNGFHARFWENRL